MRAQQTQRTQLRTALELMLMSGLDKREEFKRCKLRGTLSRDRGLLMRRGPLNNFSRMSVRRNLSLLNERTRARNGKIRGRKHNSATIFHPHSSARCKFELCRPNNNRTPGNINRDQRQRKRLRASWLRWAQNPSRTRTGSDGNRSATTLADKFRDTLRATFETSAIARNHERSTRAKSSNQYFAAARTRSVVDSQQRPILAFSGVEVSRQNQPRSVSRDKLQPPAINLLTRKTKHLSASITSSCVR